MYNETELLTKIAAGDEAAFKQLFEHHRKKLYQYVLAVTKSREVAEEIVIDVFLKLWTGRELITHIQHMDAFLFKVAYNKAMDFFKLAAKNAKLQKLVSEQMAAHQEQSADYSLLNNECREILNNAYKQLSPQRRLMITLSREKGMTHEEIATELNLSRNTVKNTITDSLKIIKQYLLNNHITPVVYILLLSDLFSD
ncbi:RNA polymerase sigma-70 factor, ECF subfamily [Chitinophaga ginsengisegetis]|uniref:RNA polymerase sigma-70 factor, ECF subfamily n=1 Tax=Chitinophaga ginsengisegetis TaxID=393003 RepID=A0A1T5N7Z4_9BACT|nr:sigma-70 family RNA polymerase sigma factor [Chitinophaga ginsengisegetis]SKC96393.1 RNA polymerase sigma-70 factor, ECF subfamily [Chitinophaga ginsengisegetis]